MKLRNPFDKPFFFFFFFLCVSFLHTASSSPEKSALLHFKSTVADLDGILSAWNSVHHCSFPGVTCNSRAQVISLRVSGSSQKGKLEGKLSPLLGKLSKLRVLSLPFHELRGGIPREIWGLPELEVLDLEGNLISTMELELPPSGLLRKLRVLNLGFNRIRGSIPGSISRLEGLEVLNLAGNELNGSIPAGLGNCRRLKTISLSSNSLTGRIPGEFGRLRRLRALDVSRNVLDGLVPKQLGNCRQLSVLILENEQGRFRGWSVPVEITSLPSLRVVWAPGGIVPKELGECKSLEMVGRIGGAFERCRRVHYLDLSENKLTGLFPGRLSRRCSEIRCVIVNVGVRVSGLGNLGEHSAVASSSSNVRRTLSDVSERYASPENRSENHVDSSSAGAAGNNGMGPIEIASVASASAIVSVLILLVILFFYLRKWAPNAKVQVSEPKEIIEFGDIGVPLLYEEIVLGTENFSTRNCIGNGGFGATYKAEIAPGTLVAIKRLAVGRFNQGVQQFHAEIKALGRMKHPNLVTLLGFHASESEMFLVYNYLPRGNLESFIRERSAAATVEWKTLHKIALDVARALTYCHDQRILHRDVKPSNILLDDALNAYLSDFGLARLLGTSETHATTGVAGTFGYVAPEYAMTCRVSEKADVYSYGVVLLELISDKKALDPSFSSQENGFNIVSWACMLLRNGRAKHVFTAGLWETSPHDDLVEMLHLAVTCTDETLSTRPTMKQVLHRLRQIRPVPK